MFFKDVAMKDCTENMQRIQLFGNNRSEKFSSW